MATLETIRHNHSLEEKAIEQITNSNDLTYAEDVSKELGSPHDAAGRLKVDPKTGAVLSPQPTDDPNDPLNFPQWLKWLILGQVALAALQTPLNSSITIATFADLAAQWGVSVPYVSYLIAIGVVPNAIGVSPTLLLLRFAHH